MFITQSSPSLLEASSAANPIRALILVVVNAILEVFFLCLVGWILAKKGIVNDSAKKVLNKLNVSLFTPALLFSKVAFSLSPDKLKDLAIIPVGFVIISILSATVAFLMGGLLRLKRSQRNFAIACAMFQNSNSLPIALMQSLIGEKMPLQWGPGDSKDQMLGRALSYLVLFSTLGIIVRWSIGVRLLTSAEAQDDSSIILPTDENGYGSSDESPLLPERRVRPKTSFAAETTVVPASPPTPPRGANGGRDRTTLVLLGADEELAEAEVNGNGKQRKSRPQSIFQSFPNTPSRSHRTSVYSSEESEDEDEGDEEWGVEHGVGRKADEWEWWESVKRKTGKVWRPIRRTGRRIGEFMTVPLWAALLSLFVACVPPLQAGLNELEPLKAAIRNAGNCSVPITLVTLGAYFYRPSPPSTGPSQTFLARLNPFSKRARADRREASRTSPGETRTVLVAVLSRMIIVPLILLPLFGYYASITENVADDPVFIVVGCLLIGSPTAITLAQITSSAAGDTFEILISRTLFVSYAILTAPCTIALVLAALYIDKKQ